MVTTLVGHFLSPTVVPPPETWTPFVGAKPIVVPDQFDLSEFRPGIVSSRRPLHHVMQSPANEPLNRSAFAYIMHHRRGAELRWAGIEAHCREKWYGLLFFVGATLQHPSGEVVVPYLCFGAGKPPSWNVLSVKQEITTEDAYCVA